MYFLLCNTFFVLEYYISYERTIQNLYRRYLKWEIVVHHVVIVKFFGSLSYFYYFSVVAVITVAVDAIMVVANFTLKMLFSKKAHKMSAYAI